jgi:5-methylcytosine-specific restriction endonuclease McrA
VSAYIPVDLKQKIQQYDRARCCYCLTQEINSGIALSFDHILPQSRSGATSFENVCLACRSCNEFKSDQIAVIDPLTGNPTPLFHPRQHAWQNHFTWSEDGTRIEGLTTIGRATVLALQLNHVTIQAARRRWVSSGWHPPTD